MPLRVHEVRLPLDAPDAALLPAVLQKAGLREEEVGSFRVVRRSLDRRRRVPVFSFIVDLAMGNEALPALDGGWTPARGGR